MRIEYSQFTRLHGSKPITIVQHNLHGDIVLSISKSGLYDQMWHFAVWKIAGGNYATTTHRIGSLITRKRHLKEREIIESFHKADFLINELQSADECWEVFLTKTLEYRANRIIQKLGRFQ